jgi:hypothetical protein
MLELLMTTDMGNLVPAILLLALNDLPAGHCARIHTFYTSVKRGPVAWVRSSGGAVGSTSAKRLLVKGVPTGFVASVLGDSEEIVRKWISERQEAIDRASRDSWNG